MIDYKDYKNFVKDLTPSDKCDLLFWIEQDIKVQLYDVFSDYLTLKNYKTEDSFDDLNGIFHFEDKPSLKDISDEIKLEFLNKLGFSNVSFIQTHCSENYFKIYMASNFDRRPTGWYKDGGMKILENGSITGNPIWFGGIK